MIAAVAILTYLAAGVLFAAGSMWEMHKSTGRVTSGHQRWLLATVPVWPLIALFAAGMLAQRVVIDHEITEKALRPEDVRGRG